MDMAQCPLPANEEERLAAVHSYSILDTAPEVEFDVTTRVASHLFNAPIALVALMDRNRLWFKSRHGLNVEQLDRQIAFCAHAIVRPDQLMVIEDLREDPRFAQNPLVTGGPELRFYAGAPLRDRAGHALGTIAVLGMEPRRFTAEQRDLLRDLSVSVMTAIENRHRALELRRMATTDHLTGLANRIQFETALAIELRQNERVHQAVSVLYLDLDGFKSVNDRFGHAAGDVLLREVAQRLQKLLRAGDTLARLGGDEFGIVMRCGSDADSATSLAARIVEALAEPMSLGGGDAVRVGVSIGIATQAAGTADASTLIEQADNALYDAKIHPSSQWSVFGGHGHASPIRDLNAALQNAATGDGGTDASPPTFTMAFQPIVRASDRSVYAFEALVRGTDGRSASDVLACVTRRKRHAFDQACRRMAIERAARLGIVARGAQLAINCLPDAMAEPESCVHATIDAAHRAGVPLERLIFEVARGDEILDASRLAGALRVFREHGLQPALDNFGTGQVGLQLLARFQPQIIKIDESLVRNIDACKARHAIVRGLLSVCSELDITPVAEAVETVAEFHTLRDLGVDLFQGFLFARPAIDALPEVEIPD